ncbi:MAG: reverse transcriptase domain-containing protein, partial [Gaiellaceae bacterium]
QKRDAKGHTIGNKNTNPLLDTREYIIAFPDGKEETHVLNTLAQALYSQVDEYGNKYYIFEDIIGHKRGKGGRGRTKGWLLEILWKDGTTTWETLSAMKESHMVQVARYAVNNHLETESAFSFWVPHVLSKQDRIIKTMQRRRLNNGYKYGIQIPKNVDHALKLDKQGANHYWRDAIQKEMSAVECVFDVKADGETAPEGYKKIPLRMIFDVKMDFTRKARLVAGGHKTDPPTSLTYSSVASRESVRLAFLLAGLNNLEIIMTDVGNAYLNATTKEKVYAIAGPEFGEFQGRAVVLVRALYGLKSSGASWHDHLADKLRDLEFSPSRGDPDVWLRKAAKPDGMKYYEYIVVYVDDLLIISHDPYAITDALSKSYTLKDIGPPKRYLGSTIGRYTLPKPNGIGNDEFWSLSAEDYLKHAIVTVEERFTLHKKHSSTPLENGYHPEICDSPLLNDDEANYYQSLIGVLQWIVELGRIDIAYSVSAMSRFTTMPRESHLRNVLRIFAYLKSHVRSRLVMDFVPRKWGGISFVTHDWTSQYYGVEELIPPDMPEPCGKSLDVSFFCDAAHATDLATRRSTTGIIIFCNGAPIKWYTKKQNTIETSTYGSEFVALRIAVEMIEGLRYKLRMMGVPVPGPANGFCDNQSVVINSTWPDSSLKKRHNAISYHKVRECIAAKVIRLAKEDGTTNLADILTKPLSAPRMKFLSERMMF